VISGRGAHNAFPAFIAGQMSHLVVRASQLEAEDGLKIFTFEEDIAF
jgi:hypothetical protein